MDRLSGSKPTLPGMSSASRGAGTSINGIACDTFIVTVVPRECPMERERHMEAPEIVEAKPETMGETNAIVVLLGIESEGR